MRPCKKRGEERQTTGFIFLSVDCDEGKSKVRLLLCEASLVGISPEHDIVPSFCTVSFRSRLGLPLNQSEVTV